MGVLLYLYIHARRRVLGTGRVEKAAAGPFTRDTGPVRW
jgi:hypothetical protein